MSVIIGSEDQFAVEYDLRPPDGVEQAHWLHGNICFWVARSRIGDYELGGALTVALATFSRLLRDRGHHYDRELMERPLDEAFNKAYSALYVDSGQSQEEDGQAADYYGRFIAVPTGFDVFDGWIAFLVEDRDNGRYLWRGPDDTLHEARLAAGEFDRVLDAFLTDLEQISGQNRTG